MTENIFSFSLLHIVDISLKIQVLVSNWKHWCESHLEFEIIPTQFKIKVTEKLKNHKRRNNIKI